MQRQAHILTEMCIRDRPYGVVPAYSVKVPRVSTYSGFRHANRPFTYGAFTLSGRPSQAVLLSLLDQFRGPNPGVHALRFGLFRFRSPLLPESHVVFSSSGYLDVSVHRVPLLTLCIGVRIPEVCLLYTSRCV